MRLSNHRHDAYAVARAAGYSQTESAKRAGFPGTSAPNAGYRLERQETIKQRVAELLAEERQDDAEIATRPWIVCNLAEIVRIGLHPDSRDLGNANRALEMLAKIGGYMMDKKESRSEGNLMSLSSGQLRELLDARLAELAPAVRERVLLLASADAETEVSHT